MRRGLTGKPVLAMIETPRGGDRRRRDRARGGAA